VQFHKYSCYSARQLVSLTVQSSYNITIYVKGSYPLSMTEEWACLLFN